MNKYIYKLNVTLKFLFQLMSEVSQSYYNNKVTNLI